MFLKCVPVAFVDQQLLLARDHTVVPDNVAKRSQALWRHLRFGDDGHGLRIRTAPRVSSQRGPPKVCGTQFRTATKRGGLDSGAGVSPVSAGVTPARLFEGEDARWDSRDGRPTKLPSCAPPMFVAE